MFLMGAADITPATTGIGMGGGFRRFIFPAYYPVFAVSAVVFWPSRLSLAQPGSAWLVRRLSCPGSGVAGAWRAQRGVVDIQAKNTRQGTGRRPQSSERGVIAIQRNRCCPRSSTAGRRSRFRPRVASGSRKTGCANRNFAVWSPDENSPGRGPGRSGHRDFPWEDDPPRPAPEFLPIWNQALLFHCAPASGQLRQTGSGDDTMQHVMPQPLRSFTNRLGFRVRGISEQPWLVRFRGHG